MVVVYILLPYYVFICIFCLFSACFNIIHLFVSIFCRSCSFHSKSRASLGLQPVCCSYPFPIFMNELERRCLTLFGAVWRCLALWRYTEIMRRRGCRLRTHILYRVCVCAVCKYEWSRHICCCFCWLRKSVYALYKWPLEANKIGPFEINTTRYLFYACSFFPRERIYCCISYFLRLTTCLTLAHRFFFRLHKTGSIDRAIQFFFYFLCSNTAARSIENGMETFHWCACLIRFEGNVFCCSEACICPNRGRACFLTHDQIRMCKFVGLYSCYFFFSSRTLITKIINTRTLCLTILWMDREAWRTSGLSVCVCVLGDGLCGSSFHTHCIDDVY